MCVTILSLNIIEDILPEQKYVEDIFPELNQHRISGEEVGSVTI